jgi:hypothetical protein
LMGFDLGFSAAASAVIGAAASATVCTAFNVYCAP